MEEGGGGVGFGLGRGVTIEKNIEGPETCVCNGSIQVKYKFALKVVLGV